MGARAKDVRRALVLSAVSAGLGSLMSVAALALGLAAGSLSLLGFGVDAAIDASASVVLVWRFHIEGREPTRAARVEHLAERVIGAVLLVAATFLAIGAARALLLQSELRPSPAQYILLVASLVILPPLAVAKRRVALQLGSKALRNDALLTGAAAVLAAVALLAIELAGVGVWWADAAGSGVIAAVLAREGWGSLALGQERP